MLHLLPVGLAALLQNPIFWSSVIGSGAYIGGNLLQRSTGTWKEQAEFEAMQKQRESDNRTAAMLAGYKERAARQASREKALDRAMYAKLQKEELARKAAGEQIQAMLSTQALRSAAASDMIQGIPQMSRFRSQEITDAAMANQAKGYTFADMLFG